MADDYIYKVIFFNQGEIYEIYARKVSQGGLFGFVEVEELAFGQGTKVVIDPSQERLEREFEGVKRTHVPLHTRSCASTRSRKRASGESRLRKAATPGTCGSFRPSCPPVATLLESSAWAEANASGARIRRAAVLDWRQKAPTTTRSSRCVGNFHLGKFLL